MSAISGISSKLLSYLTAATTAYPSSAQTSSDKAGASDTNSLDSYIRAAGSPSLLNYLTDDASSDSSDDSLAEVLGSGSYSTGRSDNLYSVLTYGANGQVNLINTVNSPRNSLAEALGSDSNSASSSDSLYSVLTDSTDKQFDLLNKEIQAIQGNATTTQDKQTAK